MKKIHKSHLIWVYSILATLDYPLLDTLQGMINEIAKNLKKQLLLMKIEGKENTKENEIGIAMILCIICEEFH